MDMCISPPEEAAMGESGEAQRRVVSEDSSSPSHVPATDRLRQREGQASHWKTSGKARLRPCLFPLVPGITSSLVMGRVLSHRPSSTASPWDGGTCIGSKLYVFCSRREERPANCFRAACCCSDPF
ncbi:hypothetical protein IF1G_09730 [Cordyceps javanica]|uniref:Uncharacterized protein n=1 Tax=Cordyceps javanica TaxID=43265 RepID=A0A545UQB7_9HYPO|nr:hypothetical protein IF1G_09730 [Cordyceps javanica]